MLRCADSDLEIRKLCAATVEQNESDTRANTKGVQSIDVLFLRVSRYHEIRFVREQPVGASLSKGGDRLAAVRLDLRYDYFKRRLEDVTLASLEDAENVGSTPFRAKHVAAERDGLSTLLEILYEVVCEGLIELGFSNSALNLDWLHGLRRDNWGVVGLEFQ